MKARTLLCAAMAALALAAGAGGVHAQTQLQKAGWGKAPPTLLDDAKAPEEIIRDGYQSFSELSLRAGKVITFEIDDFDLYRSSELSAPYWLDIVTMPGGSMILPARNLEQDQEGNLIHLSYDPKWILQPNHLDSPEGQELKGMTVAEVVARAAEDSPELLGIVGLSTYRVTISFEGQTRTYRAAFAWLPHPGEPGRVDPMVLDNVVQGLGNAIEDIQVPLVVVEPSDPELEAELLRAAPGTVDAYHGLKPIGDQALDEIASCYSDDTAAPNGTDYLLSFREEHLTGDHGTFFRNTWSCVCSSTCSQTCNALTSFVACQEFGDLTSSLRCHKLSLPSIAKSRGYTFDGVNQPVGCAVSIGCAWQSCFGCLCGSPSVSVGVAGQGGAAGFTYTWSPPDATLMTDGVSLNFCPPCKLTLDTSSPIVVNLDGRGLRFSSAAEGVTFDIDSNGTPDRISWTRAGDRTAFLALDRDGNGRIDGGGELFGTVTAQPSSRAPNGYLALAVFDEPQNGGNGDGLISAEDDIYSSLVLWVDADHDGQSQADEQLSLESQGVTSFDLGYALSKREDPHGNLLRYWGFAQIHGKRVHTVDVFFVFLRP